MRYAHLPLLAAFSLSSVAGARSVTDPYPRHTVVNFVPILVSHGGRQSQACNGWHDPATGIIGCAFLVLGCAYLGESAGTDAEMIMPRVLGGLPVVACGLGVVLYWTWYRTLPARDEEDG